MTMIVNTPFIYDRNCIRIYEEITNKNGRGTLVY